MVNGFKEFLRGLRRIPMTRRSSQSKGRDRRRAEYRSVVEAMESRVLLTPVISDISNQFVVENTSSDAIAFTIDDAETPANDLDVMVISSDETIVPIGNIVLGGSGTDRTIMVTPAADQVGTTTITVTVIDGDGLEATDTFEFTATANQLVPFGLPEYYGDEIVSYSSNQATGDFNGDGNVDLIMAGNTFNDLAFLEGNGDGTFQAGQVLNAGLDTRVSSLSVVDYDNDGDADFIAYEYTQATLDGTADEGAITLYRNDGDANFTREVLIGGLVQGFWTATGDLDNDGLADVAYGAYRFDFETRTIMAEKAYALQQPDGSLGEKSIFADYYGDIVIEDIDGDGNLDIVSTGSVFDLNTFTSTNYLQIFPGNGDGTFGAAQDVDSEAAPEIHQVVDLNGDGLKDLLVYDRAAEGHLGYYPQLDDGSFGERVPIMAGHLYSQHNLATDMNGDDVPDIVSYSYFGNGYRVSWAPNLGAGEFGAPILITQESAQGGFQVADLDNDTYPDLIIASSTSETRSGPIGVLLNKTEEDPMVLLPPEARTRVEGDPIDLQVYFGFPIEVTGTPRVELQVGDNTVFADYLSGSGTPFLTFRYTVGSTDFDLDGVQLASNMIDLNGGTLTDPVGGEGVLEFPNTLFEGVFVNAVGPLVDGITRLDSTPTDVDTVRFEVTFQEDVMDVDAADFEVVMNAGDLSGATIESVTGSGTTYVVTVTTGTGSGALALNIEDDASITNDDGFPLARGYFGGEVYTLRRGEATPVDHYFTDGHADYHSVWDDGELTLAVRGDDGVGFASNEIAIYADTNAIEERPDDTAYDFIGVDPGEPIYVLPSSQVPGVPFLGFSYGIIPDGLFASYVPDDPRITSSTPRPYIRLEMADMRTDSGGEFSLWSTPSSGPRVYMTTSDGISSEDSLWISGHLHRNIAFTQPGIYEIDVFASGYLDVNGNGTYEEGLDSYYESGLQTMVFTVDTLGAADDTFTIYEGETLEADVSVNDDWHEAMGDYTATLETDVANGMLTLNADGSFTYEPNTEFTGTDSFIYRVTNERGGFTTATATIRVSANRAVPFSLSQPAATDRNLSYQVAAADLTGDGLDDLLVVTTSDRDITYAPSLGGGDFGDLRVIEPGAANFVSDAYPLDLDNDGDLDVLAVGTDTLQYYLNDGSGNFSSPVTIASGALFIAAVADDLDGDGDTDFAVTDRTDGSVYLFRNNGDGSFVREVVGTGFDGLRGLVSLDADGDGDLDLIASADGTNKISLFANDGAGNFADEVVLTTDVEGIRYLYSADIDADGNVDFVSTAFASSELAWYRSGGDGTFEKHVVAADASGIIAAAIGDIDGDGDLDLISGGFRDSSVAWYANDGGGNFTDRQVISAIPGGGILSVAAGDFDGDGNVDAAGAGTPIRSISSVFFNLSGEFSNQVVPPEDGIYFEGEAITFDVHFGIPVDVTGTPEVQLQIGDRTVSAEYISGSGTPTLRFQYVVDAADRDLDGIAFASATVILPAGATMIGPTGDDVDRTLPATDMSSVVVNGSAPRVASITRLDPAATAQSSMRFAITFNEAVTGVTIDNFAVHIADGISDAAVTDVTGEGSEYIVTVDTGSGSGTLGLTNSADGIVDTEGNGLATPILGGEVYTLQRRPARQIDNYFTEGHADIGILYGDNHWSFQAPGSDLDADEVLIVGGPDSVVMAPAGSEFDFLGATAGSDIYLLPQTDVPPTVPDLGISSTASPSDAFAAYTNTDPRVDATAEWLELHLVGMRGPEGGEFSLYSSGLTEPTVWMASSDGIDDSDSLFTPSGSHGHYNWAFTQPGVYEIDVFASGFLDANGNGTFDEGIDPYSESGITTL
uniref:FG-GAP-like repeat-containing protein n=1 Tax=Thalassoroseus pseudoceratinae TaxID=2713176 RepID=UPI001421283C